MTAQQPYKIVILGGGSAGWMTAAALRKFLPKDHQISLLESKEIGTVSVGEATIPGIIEFNHMLGIDEREFLAYTKGSFKLGIEFRDWGTIGSTYIHPFGPYGLPMNGLSFHHYWLKQNINASAQAIAHYNLEYSAAKANKFCHPQQNSRSPLSSLRYAYHFDATRYADFLRQYSVKHGVKRMEGTLKKVLQHDDGNIQALVLKSGQRLDADLFIDCSGFKGLLISETLKVDYEDWREMLPCDAAIAVPSESLEELTPYTIATAHAYGWQWQIPLQHRTGNGFVYASEFLSEDDAYSLIQQRLPSKAIAEPRKLQWINGKREKAWVKNCVAIGLSQGFVEPLESTGLHLIQSAINKLIALFPNGKVQEAQIKAFNRYTDQEMYAIRDFIVMHYKLHKRKDSDFWRHCQHMPMPQTLIDKLELYKQSGNIFRDNNELFNEISWFSVMHGQGLNASRYHPRVDAMSEEHRHENMKRIGDAIQTTVASMPDHKHYLNQYLNGINV